jgi:predicted Rossmann fold nucleotide-binding protein DprA/Smf involved in DNA uptake
MTAAEEGVLLLCCSLGDADCRPLTMAQFRQLGLRARALGCSGDAMADLSHRELLRLGYSAEETQRILELLSRQKQLETYMRQAEQLGIRAITRVSTAYPVRISHHRKLSSPPVLFAMGDLSLLDQPAISVVGSRRLRPENEAFAAQAGRISAEGNLILVSGGAQGADLAAQKACLASGGRCIVVLPDRLADRRPEKNILYLSADGYDLPFSAPRALYRNTLIHMLGDKTLAAQCTYGSGGTWQGCTENLKHGWSELYVFDDGSQGSCALIERGATPVAHLRSIDDLQPTQTTLF